MLIAEVKESISFSLILDSTPDFSHVNQLRFNLRYVTYGFLPIKAHDATYLEKMIVDTLREMSIGIKFYRGKTYDNASNTGKYNGLQAKIHTYCPDAVYIPCVNQSLNLVGNRGNHYSTAPYYYDFVQ